MINTSPTDGHADDVTVVFTMSPSNPFSSVWVVNVNGGVKPREAAIHASSIIPVTAPVELYVNGKKVDMSDFNVAC